MTDTSEWDRRMLTLARHVAMWSKDPSTKVGAVITDARNRVLSLGYNGYPRGVPDTRLYDREHKYERIVHAEMNALMFAGVPLQGATLYVWPMPPCSRCAGPIIQAGIVRVVAPPAKPHWQKACAIGAEMFQQAGVVVQEFDLP
jgi:dCMP deaminase